MSSRKKTSIVSYFVKKVTSSTETTEEVVEDVDTVERIQDNLDNLEDSLPVEDEENDEVPMESERKRVRGIRDEWLCCHASIAFHDIDFNIVNHSSLAP